jgi:short-subunit dehydrogenase
VHPLGGSSLKAFTPARRVQEVVISDLRAKKVPEVGLLIAAFYGCATALGEMPMKTHLKPLREQVIVITGASSGIGLTTARLAASRGAKALVLLARSEDALHQLEQELNASERTHAVAVAGDVSNEGALRRVAETAIERFGGFDTWVNNAGISVYGRLMEVSEEDHRRLFETNFWGIVHGCQVAVDYLKDHGGSIINLGSTVSDRAIPLQGMYSASKHAVKGYTDSLRMELEERDYPISVTLIKPSAINTPFTRHAKNYMEDAPTFPPPVYAPDLVAEAILYAAENPMRDIMVGSGAKAFQLFETISPRATDRFMETAIFKQQHSGRQRYLSNALFRPSEELNERGDYEGMVRETSLYTGAVTHPGVSLSALVGTGLAIAAGMMLMRHSDKRPRRMPKRNLPPMFMPSGKGMDEYSPPPPSV